LLFGGARTRVEKRYLSLDAVHADYRALDVADGESPVELESERLLVELKGVVDVRDVDAVVFCCPNHGSTFRSCRVNLYFRTPAGRRRTVGARGDGRGPTSQRGPSVGTASTGHPV